MMRHLPRSSLLMATPRASHIEPAATGINIPALVSTASQIASAEFAAELTFVSSLPRHS